MIRGVFLDFYDTLTLCDDPRKAWDDWAAALYDALEGPLPMEDVRQTFARMFDGPPPAGRPYFTAYERRIEAFCRGLGWCPTAETVRRAATASVWAWGAHMRLDPEAAVLLDALRPSLATALISNYDHPPHIRAVLEQWDLLRRFDAVAISGEVGAWKPDPAIFRGVLEALRLSPEEVVFVGDSDVDVEGAKAAGCRPVRIRRAGVAGTPDGAPVLTRLSDLPRLLELV